MTFDFEHPIFFQKQNIRFLIRKTICCSIFNRSSNILKPILYLAVLVIRQHTSISQVLIKCKIKSFVWNKESSNVLRSSDEDQRQWELRPRDQGKEEDGLAARKASSRRERNIREGQREDHVARSCYVSREPEAVSSFFAHFLFLVI